MLDHAITAFDDLREHIGEPHQRVLDKQLDHLDRHCRDFIERSPIAMLATADAEGRSDCSPRGAPQGSCASRRPPPRDPGLHRQPPSRLERQPARELHVALLFLLPGMGETLRVNGGATPTREPELLEGLITGGT